MNPYIVYNQQISSEIEFPELASGSVPPHQEPDATIRWGNIPLQSSELSADSDPVFETSDELYSVHRTSEGLYWFYEDKCSVLIPDGNNIIINARHTITPEEIRQFLLGPALRALLIEQGHLVFHSSAISIGKKGVMFLGEPGTGKSTTATAFCYHGCTPISDDVVPIYSNDRRNFIPPAFPAFKLHPEAAELFHLKTSSASDTDIALDRQYYSITDRFDTNPVELKRIYILQWGETIKIEPIRKQLAVFLLMKMSYLLYNSSDSERISSHFSQCTDLINEVPVNYLYRPKSLKELEKSVEVVKDDLKESSD